MSEFPFYYVKVNPVSWVYLSSLLTIAIYFKFSRLWSMRNLDLIGLILLAPGLVMAQYGQAANLEGMEQTGYIWLFTAGGLFLCRMLVDPMMVRRPLLEPNLSAGGLTFLGLSLLMFLLSGVVAGSPDRSADRGETVRTADGLATESAGPTDAERLTRQGPGFPYLFSLPNIVSQNLHVQELNGTLPSVEDANVGRQNSLLTTTRILAILSHVMVVLGMVLIGYRHFDNTKTGIAAAALYLLLPYTAQSTGYVRHVLPAALLVWAIVAYRRPLISGILIGLAIGASYYPVFLLPLWLSFYWQRGLLRFVVGVASMLAVLVAVLAVTAADRESFFSMTQQMFGWIIPRLMKENFDGFWRLDLINSVYRIPVLAGFVALCGTLAIWPAQKNLGTLMSCSAAVMLGSQFWNAHGGGLYVAWYLPLLLLTIFRPNLEDRVALSVLGEGWFPKRRAHLTRVDKAA